MARQELGTKRVCPETGRKFYDLNKDPIVSPYTGISYPRSFFEANSEPIEEEEVEETAEVDSEGASAEMVSLEEADEEAKGGGDASDLDGDDDVDLGDDDDTFLEDDEEGDDDVSDIIGVGGEDDEEH